MQAKQGDSHIEFEVPREHGFWVMLGVVTVAAIGRSVEIVPAAGVAAGLVVSTILLGGRLHKTVRKSPWAQVAASALLGALALPIEGIGQVSIRLAVFDSLAWMAVFAAFSLSVRAIFARARKRGSGARNSALALALPPICGLALYLVAGHRNTVITAVGFAGCLLFAIWRPKPRHLKQSGVMMTVLLVLALAAVLAR